MNIYNKKYLFINGTSISVARGFEEYQYRKDVRDLYQKIKLNAPMDIKYLLIIYLITF